MKLLKIKNKTILATMCAILSAISYAICIPFATQPSETATSASKSIFTGITLTETLLFLFRISKEFFA